MKKIALYQFADTSIHFAVSLEILRSEYLKNNEVYYCNWGQKTLYPVRMAKSWVSLSGKTPRHISKLIRMSAPTVNLSSHLDVDLKWVEVMVDGFSDQLKNISDVAQLSTLNIDGIEPGAAVANELVTLVPDRDLSVINYLDLIILLIQSYLIVYSSTKNHISKNSIEIVYVYNGRFLHERAVRDAALSLNLKCLLFETLRERFQIREKGFHDRINNQKIMIDIWEESKLDLHEKIILGSNWFEGIHGKKNMFDTGSNNNFSAKKDFFVYYCSSDEEMVGFWDSWTEPLGNQYECILKLIDIFSSQDDYQLLIKLHPSLNTKPLSVIKKMVSIPTKNNSMLITHEMNFSTYDLLNKSIGTLTIGSTIGVESAFYNKPVLLLADAKYDELNLADKAKTWDDVIVWIKKAKYFEFEEIRKRKINSCIFGFYYSQAGIRFSHTDLVETNVSGAYRAEAFMGTNIAENNVIVVLRKILSVFKIFIYNLKIFKF